MISLINQEEWIRASIARIREIWLSDQTDADLHSFIVDLLNYVEISFTGQKKELLPLFILPYTCAKIYDGSQEYSEQVTSAWLSYYLSAHLLDSIEDAGDTSPFLENYSPSVKANLATSLLITAQQILSELDSLEDPFRAVDIRRYFFDKIKRMCSGQHLDLTLTAPTLDQAWSIAEAKSGDFFALACLAGARIGNQNPVQLKGFETFGYHLGTLIQIEDDIQDLRGNSNSPGDLILRKRSLPVAYAIQVLPITQSKLLNDILANAPSNKQAETDARKMILETGAFVYLICEAEKRCRLGQRALFESCPPSPIREHLADLIKWTASRIWA
jgi:hypothetical protein